MSARDLPITCRAKATFSRDRLVAEQAEVLEDGADLAAQPRHLPAREPVDLLAGDVHATRGGAVLTQHQPQEGRLAGAGGADEEDELALLDVDRHLVEGRVGVAGVGLGDLLEANHGPEATRWTQARIGAPPHAGTRRTSPQSGVVGCGSSRTPYERRPRRSARRRPARRRDRGGHRAASCWAGRAGRRPRPEQPDPGTCPRRGDPAGRLRHPDLAVVARALLRPGLGASPPPWRSASTPPRPGRRGARVDDCPADRDIANEFGCSWSTAGDVTASGLGLRSPGHARTGRATGPRAVGVKCEEREDAPAIGSPGVVAQPAARRPGAHTDRDLRPGRRHLGRLRGQPRHRGDAAAGEPAGASLAPSGVSHVLTPAPLGLAERCVASHHPRRVGVTLVVSYVYYFTRLTGFTKE